MDINSIGSVPYLPGTSTAQGTAQAAARGEVRENFAATGKAAPNQENNPDTQNVPGEVDREELRNSVDALNNLIKLQQTSLQFSIDDESGTVIVKVTDKETEEVIKQIPSEDAMALAKALDKLKGILLHQEA